MRQDPVRTQLTIAQALEQASRRLRDQMQPRLEAEVLLAHVLGKARSHLHAWPESLLDADQYRRFDRLVDQRVQGQPVAYLTGRREFWSLDLEVTAATLIPRPETELLVEQTLALVPAGARSVIADLGTGSGAIALALAHERPGWQLIASDRSADCLAVAAANRSRFALPNLLLVRGDWCEPLADDSLDALVSNPPYIPCQDPHLRQGDVAREPRAALSAGDDGLDAIRTLVATAPRVLKPGAWILLEHGLDQGEAVRNLMKDGAFTEISTIRDLAGLERVTRARAAL
ncbi:MAG TPA: peptide chain release factor N(5)-glutamine methyltransferase [Gammaproteobacteria bacterium]|nr:peptide chain release factor N(5)-glutamine methyltransferase [Gammaproteobacteria bacterium]